MISMLTATVCGCESPIAATTTAYRCDLYKIYGERLTFQKVPAMQLRLGLLAIMLGVYWLLYIPAPEDADGMAMVAVAQNMIQHGRVDINVIGASDWLLLPRGKMGTFGLDGALYSKKGITPSLLMIPFVAAGTWLPWLSVRATAGLFNSVVLALTGLLLLEYCLRLGYRPRTGSTLALSYGLGTFAVTYTKTLFAEPLAALLLLGAVVALDDFARARQKRWLLAGATLAALLVGINLIYGLVVAVLGLYVLFLSLPHVTLPQDSNWRFGWRRGVYFGVLFSLPLLAMGGLLLGYNAFRFGNPLNTGYQFAAGEGFTYPLLDGLYGTLFSPYRGLFWYTPVLLAAIPAWFLFRRQHGRVAWLLLALVLIQLLAFASWWSWYGGIVWGPRFLLPCLPLGMLILAPAVDLAWRRRALFIGLGVLFVITAFIQVVGLWFSYLPYTGYLIAAFAEPIPRAVIADPWLSPIVGHLALLWGGYPSDLFIMRTPFTGLQLALCAGTVAAGVIIPRFGSGAVKRVIPSLTVCILIIFGLAVASLPTRSEASTQAVQALDTVLRPPGMVVAATQLFGDQLVDLRGGNRVLSMNAPTSPTDERARLVWQYALKQDRKLWFVTWFPPVAEQNWQERELWSAYAFVKEVNVAQHRALLFDLGAPPVTMNKVEATFGKSIRLLRYGAQPEADGVTVTLVWQATTQQAAVRDAAPLPQSWFVHLLDANGQIIAQQDRQPQGGWLPTAQWSPQQQVTDRLFFLLPANLAQRSLSLRIGWIDPATGQPISVFTADGQALTDPFLIAEIKP